MKDHDNRTKGKLKAIPEQKQCMMPKAIRDKRKIFYMSLRRASGYKVPSILCGSKVIRVRKGKNRNIRKHALTRNLAVVEAICSLILSSLSGCNCICNFKVKSGCLPISKSAILLLRL